MSLLEALGKRDRNIRSVNELVGSARFHKLTTPFYLYFRTAISVENLDRKTRRVV